MLEYCAKSVTVALALMLGLMAAEAQQPPAASPMQVVQGAYVNIVANWNEAKDAVGVYQAPAGYVIKSATPVIKSQARASSSVEVSGDRREARLLAHARGKGEFWNKERGWIDAYLNIELLQQ